VYTASYVNVARFILDKVVDPFKSESNTVDTLQLTQTAK